MSAPVQRNCWALRKAIGGTLDPVNARGALLPIAMAASLLPSVTGCVSKYRPSQPSLPDGLRSAVCQMTMVAKCDRLGLGYPGGPEIEHLALGGNIEKFKLPMPLTKKNNCDFSFSGLKTAAINTIKNNKKTRLFLRDFSASFQHTVSKVLEIKISDQKVRVGLRQTKTDPFDWFKDKKIKQTITVKIISTDSKLSGKLVNSFSGIRDKGSLSA